jgi:hypothetical protein
VPSSNPQLGDFNGSYPDYKVHASGSTTDANAKNLTFAIPGAPSVIPIPTDTAWMVTAYVVARRQDVDNEGAAWWIWNAFHNNAGTVQTFDQSTITQISALGGGINWKADVQANAGLVISVQSNEAGKTIYWNAVVHIVQVSG